MQVSLYRPLLCRKPQTLRRLGRHTDHVALSWVEAAAACLFFFFFLKDPFIEQRCSARFAQPSLLSSPSVLLSSSFFPPFLHSCHLLIISFHLHKYGVARYACHGENPVVIGVTHHCSSSQKTEILFFFPHPISLLLELFRRGDVGVSHANVCG